MRQSSELFKKCRQFFGRLPDMPEIDQESALRCEFKNGSRIVSLPGTEGTVRGFSAASLVVVDEASRVSDDLFASLRPMLAIRQGRFISLSTPWGRQGWWAEAWHSDHDYHRIKITAEQCPRLDPDWLEEEKALIGPWMYAQEYGCEFLDDAESFFPSHLIERAVSPEVLPFWQ
jgi:hypothetical protein